MIDSLFNLLFRCRHHRLTRPVTPVNADGKPEGDPYVVCLDCGKHFAYDAQQMKMGRAIQKPGTSEIPSAPARKSKLKRAAWISLPIGVVLGAVIKRKRKKRAD